jgi:hypothetical protein
VADDGRCVRLRRGSSVRVWGLRHGDGGHEWGDRCRRVFMQGDRLGSPVIRCRCCYTRSLGEKGDAQIHFESATNQEEQSR